jgi:hypothetical protein
MTEPESGTAMASVSSYRAAREDFSSRHSRPVHSSSLIWPDFWGQAQRCVEAETKKVHGQARSWQKLRVR